MNIEKTKPIRLSKWVYEYRKKGAGHIALFHALEIEAVFLELRFAPLVALLKKGTTLIHLEGLFGCGFDAGEVRGIIMSLADSKMVVPVDTDDDRQLAARRDGYVTQCGLETLYLIVTDECNLRCRYCFIHNGMPKHYVRGTMGWDTAQKAVDMFFANIRSNPPVFDDMVKMIIFYGGEPLLNFPLIQRVVEYVESKYAAELRELADGFCFSVISNGTAITEDIARFIGSHPNISVAISLDGPRDVHDSERVTAGGRGSFDDAMRGYRLLTEIGGRKNISVSCTIGEHNIDRLEDLLTMQKEHGFLTVNMNSLLDTKAGFVPKSYMVKVSKRMIEYFVKAREQGVYEDRIMRKIKCFTEKRVHPFDCQATGSQVVCSPDGKLGICHEGIGMKNFFFADVSRDFRFHQHPVITEWKRRTPLHMPQCAACPAIGVCGGGCAYGAWLRNGTIWSVDDRFCVHSLTTLEWIIWDLFAKL